MVDFYKDLNNGSDKASALRNAKLNYLRSTRTEKATHPYYWAAFLLSGNDDPLVSQSNIWASPWFLVAFVLLIAGFFIYKKKTKSTL